MGSIKSKGTIPDYDKASKAINKFKTNEIVNPKTGEINRNVIAVNLYDILFANSIQGASVDISIYSLLSEKPRIGGKATKSDKEDYGRGEKLPDILKGAGIDFKTLLKVVREVISPSVKNGWIKIQEVTEDTPRDLLNAFINKMTSSIGGTISRSVNQYLGSGDSIARL